MSRTPKQLSFGPAATSTGRSAYKPFVPGPNPELADFIARHATPYDPENDRYDVPAFDRDLVVDKAYPPKAIYDMHTYWSKKHWAAIREYIRHYLPEKYYPRGTGLVLDCFSGSGMTGVAAMMENRPCVLIDASPAAAFISHCYTHPVVPDELREAYDRMMTEPYPPELQRKLKAITGREIRNLQQELEWLYETRCDRCGGPATTEYTVYSERFQCPNCAKIVALYDCPEFKEPKKGRYCPHCTERHHGEPHKDWLISTRSRKFGSVPVLVSYKCLGRCRPARHERGPNRYDLAKIEQIEKAEIPHWYPNRKMMDVEDDSKPWGMEWRPGRDFRNIADLYTRRNLWALAAVRAATERLRATRLSGDTWLLALTAISLNASRMYRFRPSLKGGLAMGTYYLPQLSQIMRVSSQYADKRGDVIKLAEAQCVHLVGKCVVSNDDCKTAAVGQDWADFAFTDPAYVHKIQYGELNFISESWLGFDSAWLKEEIVVNPFRNKTLEDWDRDMRAALANIYRALKPGRWLSLCYHDTDPGTWRRVQDMLLDTGFEIHTVTVLDPKQKSSNQLTGEKVVKSDLVLNCRKPRPGEAKDNSREGETELVSRRVREILIETLSLGGGQPREKLWDVVLKRLLARGQMAEHRFDEILAEVAFKSESSRWFLKEEFENLSQSDIQNEEEAGAALERFARLRAMGVPAEFAAHIALEKTRLAAPDTDEYEVERYIREHLVEDIAAARKFRLGGRLKGIEFYDCLFFYLTRFLRGRPAGKIPRRNLAEFLEEYLVRFKDGDKWLYRAPDRAEAESLRKSRQTGLGRRIRQYVAFLRGEGEFPKERIPDAKTLVAWLKHCSAFGLADEGVAIYERGGLMAQLYSLSEDERFDAEEYYTNCKRKASRAPIEAEEVLEDEDSGEEE